MVVVSFHSELDGVIFYQVWEKNFFHSVELVLARIKAQDWKLSEVLC